MKLSNIFKKQTKAAAKANIEKMDKKQLERVIGGTGITTTDSSMPTRISTNITVPK